MLSACGREAPRQAELSVGTYADGSGTLGLTAVVQVRERTGGLAQGEWTATLSGPDGVLRTGIVVSTSTTQPFAALWWPEIPAAPGSDYSITLESTGGERLDAKARLVDQAPLALAEPHLDSDGLSLVWPDVPNARSYRCSVTAAGAIQLDVISSSTECDLSALPQGAYVATVSAFELDLGLASPAGTSFRMSSATTGVVLGSAPSATWQLSVAGGTIDYGGTVPGLAVAVSLVSADGQPTAEDWQLKIVGPGLSSANPLVLHYAAGAPRLVAWSYDVPAREGSYSIVATSATAAVSAAFVVGAPAVLSRPAGITVTSQPSGAATVDFGPVTGAAAYYVSVWDAATGAFAAGQWLSGPEARFPTGTFEAGRTYDVYVAASNVDPATAALLPAQVAVSENTYFPLSFAAQ